MDQQNQTHEEPENNEEPFDFTHVNSIARIALYDDLLSAPHVTEIQPAPTAEFIENLATSVYQQSKAAGGTIPYTVIREVSENFIHARFQEATVSILDNGCTIRFADQGPGIACKDRAQLPGFTSAIEPMKSYIRGVGSGLPIVKEYLDFTHGTITIEDNLGSGSVVTISANGSRPELPEELKLESEAPEAAPAPRYHIASGDEAPEPIAAPRYNVAPEPYAPANQIPPSLHTRSKRPCRRRPIQLKASPNRSSLIPQHKVTHRNNHMAGRRQATATHTSKQPLILMRKTRSKRSLQRSTPALAWQPLTSASRISSTCSSTREPCA